MRPYLAILLNLLFIGDSFAQQLMSEEKLNALRASFPVFVDPEVNAIVNDPTLVLYTDDEMPPAFQSQLIGGGRTHFESINVTKNENDRLGLPTNPNREFPWKSPGGTDVGERYQDEFRFFLLPKKEDGTPHPVIVYNDYVDKSIAINMPTPIGWRWLFPKGTIFGEVLVLNFSDGYKYTYEVRMRTREEDYWDVAVYRPFPTRESLANALEALGDTVNAAKLREKVTLRKTVLTDTRHPNRAFTASAGEYQLPIISGENIKKLLTSTPFSFVTGPWYTDENDVSVWAPTASASKPVESLVPPGYRGGFLSADTIGCVSCHKDTLRHADRFESRDWYDRVRGSDGIFSWHPIELSSIGRANADVRPVVLRSVFVRAGMVEMFDKNKHPSTMYRIAKEYAAEPVRRSDRGRVIIGG